jgi:hypothetical protein
MPLTWTLILKGHYGKTEWIGSALGFTPQGQMRNRECCEWVWPMGQLLSAPCSFSALKRYIFYFTELILCLFSGF